MNSENYCRVCGYDQEEPIWGEDGNCPTYNICACCGTEFGYEDCSPEEVREQRARWFASGKKWFREKDKLLNWDWEQQFENIPDIYK